MCEVLGAIGPHQSQRGPSKSALGEGLARARSPTTLLDVGLRTGLARAALRPGTLSLPGSLSTRPRHSQAGAASGQLHMAWAAIAQLAARRSHNPKVVSSMLTRRIFRFGVCRIARTTMQEYPCAALLNAGPEATGARLWIAHHAAGGLPKRNWQVRVHCRRVFQDSTASAWHLQHGLLHVEPSRKDRLNRAHLQKMVPRGLEPRTLRLLAVRSNQLSYETM